MKNNVYQIVTDKVIAMLDSGLVPWRKTWRGQHGAPCNLSTKKHYRGINVFMLACNSYSSNLWASYKQAGALGGQVKKGSKGSIVVFYKTLEIDTPGSDDKKNIPFLRYSTVFNLDQIDGLDHLRPAAPEALTPFDKIEAAESIIKAMPNKPALNRGIPAYNCAWDIVSIPNPEEFNAPAEYYSTLFHELAHSTGHESRLDRLAREGSRNKENYAKEELIAEMTACFLNNACQIEALTIKNNAAYIQHWRDQISKDNKLIVTAASAAQKAAEYINPALIAEAAKV